MLNFNDFYTQYVDFPLASASQKNSGQASSTIGSMHAEYNVRQIRDVRNLSSCYTYRITCKNRLVVPNSTVFSPACMGTDSFDNYPAMLTSSISLSTPTRLIDYNPRTINTTVSSSSSQNDGSTQTTTRQQTAGSSVSQTNSFSTSVSAGIAEAGPSFGISSESSQSRTIEANHSRSSGLDRGVDRQLGTSNAMSIKDWASFTYLDNASTTPTWVWAQEYPWDILQYRYSIINNIIMLPDFVVSRLFDDPSRPTQAFPPSQLSLFGIDVLMTASWDVVLPDDIDQQTVTINHNVEYATASHFINNSALPQATLSAPLTMSVPSTTLDLTLLGLEPLSDGQTSNPAVVGFAEGKFISPPAADGRFKILSDTNNVQVSGTGFDDIFSSSFTKSTTLLQVSFKVADVSNQYTLYMKNWKTGTGACDLRFVINSDQTNVITRRVDAVEGAGADGNLLQVALRNLDYTSIDFHDFLKVGMNVIDITISPASSDSVTYVLRALAIGEPR